MWISSSCENKFQVYSKLSFLNMSKSLMIATSLLALLCAVQVTLQCSPGPDYKPPTIAELTKAAPIVVRGFVDKILPKGGNTYKACMNISHVYKGRGVKSHICASEYGSSAQCLSEPGYGVEYLFFLKRKGLYGPYEAHYHTVHSAVHVFKPSLVDEIRDGKCCPRTLKNCQRYRLRCRGTNGPSYCVCKRSYQYY